MATHPAKAVACGMFRPGQLTPNDAADLNALMRQVAALQSLSTSYPLSISRAGGVTSITLNPAVLQWVILGEVTAVTSGDHTVKRLTWDGSAIADYDPLTEYENCRSTTGSDLTVGDVVMVYPIPDVSGNYWITPATGGSAGLTVEAEDGTPSYADTTTLQFEELDGFSLSQPVAGTVLVRLLAESILSKLCVVKDGDGFVTDIQYVDSGGLCQTVPECADTEGSCGSVTSCPPDPAIYTYSFAIPQAVIDYAAACSGYVSGGYTTWTLTWDAIENSWVTPDPFGPSVPSGDLRAQLTCDSFLQFYFLTITAGVTQVVAYERAWADGWNSTAPNVMTLSADTDPTCPAWPATITVTGELA